MTRWQKYKSRRGLALHLVCLFLANLGGLLTWKGNKQYDSVLRLQLNSKMECTCVVHCIFGGLQNDLFISVVLGS